MLLRADCLFDVIESAGCMCVEHEISALTPHTQENMSQLFYWQYRSELQVHSVQDLAWISIIYKLHFFIYLFFLDTQPWPPLTTCHKKYYCFSGILFLGLQYLSFHFNQGCMHTNSVPWYISQSLCQYPQCTALSCWSPFSNLIYLLV